MKVFEVIKYACYFTDNDALGNKLENLTEFDLESFAEEEQVALSSLLKKYNLVEEELGRYNFFKTQGEFEVENGKLDFTKFASPPAQIFSVKCGGKRVKYKLFDSYIEMAAKKVKIEFSYLPKKADFNDDLLHAVSARVAAYGVAREHFLAEALYDEAKIWEGRFKDGLKLLLPKKTTGRLPKRRWL